MSKIQTTDVASAPSAPPTGTHVVYTKTTGLFVMGDDGLEVGPLVAGGGPPSGAAGGVLSGTYPNPTLAAGAVQASNIADGAVVEDKLASNAVTDGKIASGAVINSKIANNAVQTAQIANNAVINTKIADGAVGAAKLTAPGGASFAHALVRADGSGTSWVFDHPSQIRMVTPARLAIVGDTGNASEPLFLRAYNWSADQQVGHYVRVFETSQSVAGPASLDLDSVTGGPTVFSITDSVGGATVYLPASTKYPPGFEILVTNPGGFAFDVASLAGSQVLVNFDGSGAGSQNIGANAGRRFMARASGWVCTGTI